MHGKILDFGGGKNSRYSKLLSNWLDTGGIKKFKSLQMRFFLLLDLLVSRKWKNKDTPYIYIQQDGSPASTSLGYFIRAMKCHEEYAKIKLICNERNMGVGFSRNMIINHAKGDFLVFFDSDDISAPTRAYKQVETIMKHETDEDVLCHTAREVIYDEHHHTTIGAYGQNAQYPYLAGEDAAKNMLLIFR